MICAWIETSSAEIGSSPTMRLGLERERARDADALALAAGEFVRVASACSALQADPLEQSRDPIAALAAGGRRLVDAAAARRRSRRAGHARVERGVGVLEDHLHAGGACGACSAARALRDVASPSNAIVAGGRLEQRAASRPIVDLPQPDLADQAERLAAAGSSKRPRRPRGRSPATRPRACPRRIGKVLLEVAAPSQQRRDLRQRRRHAGAPRGDGRACAQQATSGPGARSSSGGYSRAALRRVAKPQRGAKRQPGGSSSSSGSMPWISVRRVRSLGAARRAAGSSPAGPSV